MSTPIRCKRKKDCVIAWPESCPAWDRWNCPVDDKHGQHPKPALDDVRHGDPQPIQLEVWLGPDPELALVEADMGAWHDAHPCDCDALCECDGRGYE